MANFKNLSRYATGIVTKNRSGVDFLTLRRTLDLEPDAGDTFVVVTQEIENRPDLVASKAYGDPQLWWAIYEFNGIRDPMFDLKAGTILRIPAIERVIDAVERLGT